MPLTTRAPAMARRPASPWDSPGAAAQLAEAWPCAWHVFPEQLALPLASNFTCCETQSAAAFASSTSCCTTPLHTTTPWAEQLPVHCALAFAVQLAWAFTWHFTLQSMFPLAVHSALQLPWHRASHDALGGVPVHCPWHVARHDALHFAEQSACPDAPSPLAVPLAEQCASHVPEQSPSQWAAQSKLPGFALHDPVQLPWQLTSHDGGVTSQPPTQFAETWPSQ
jgi:hypothetical protein